MSIILPPDPSAQDDPIDWLVYPFEATFWHRITVRALAPHVVYLGPLPQRASATQEVVESAAYPGYVYVIQDGEGDVLYVGKTVNPVGRLASHRAKKSWWPTPGRLTLLGVDAPDRASADAYALNLESIANRDLDPVHNIAGVRR
jgi:hypothetical protein